MGSLGALTGRVPSARGRHLTIGSTVSGTLVTGDSVDTDGALFDEYRLYLSAGSAVTLVARGGPSRTSPGSNLDMYLVLQQNGVEVTHDDDSAGSLNSRIVHTAVIVEYTGVQTVNRTAAPATAHTAGAGVRNVGLTERSRRDAGNPSSRAKA